MSNKTEIKEILTNIGYVQDSHYHNSFYSRDTIRFNLPAIGEHVGYAIKLICESSYMYICDGGEPIIDYSFNDDKIRFTHDNLLIDHAEDYEIYKIRKILTIKTKTIIRQGKKLKNK